MDKYISVQIDNPGDDGLGVYGVETPDGDILATDECAQLLNKQAAQTATLRAELARVTAERDAAVELLRMCREPIDSAIEDWRLAGSSAAPKKWGALKADIDAVLTAQQPPQEATE